MNGKIECKNDQYNLTEISNNNFKNFDPINKIAHNLIEN